LNWIKALSLAVAGAMAALVAAAEPVTVFAAASLQGPLEQAAATWDGDVIISYGGSGAMARQISQGAPADVVLLANPDWTSWLIDKGHAPGPTSPLLSNTLVVIGTEGAQPMTEVSSETLLARLAGGRLAMGQHLSVPAGIYAKAWLDRIGAWDDLRAHLAETENVRAALALVARNETPLGIVYASDAAATDAVSVVYRVPGDAHPPILYPGLALSSVGRRFLDHLDAERHLFVAAGFREP
ncbi:MAG: molybdate ABC transporter substrate-binding protein, partial [Ruegeria sp.]